MSIIERIRERKRRKKIKDLCSCCRWYYPESGVCQIKKCSGNGGYGYVTKRDRKRCDNFDRKPIEEDREKLISEDGVTIIPAKQTTHGEDAVDALRYATGYKDTLEDGIGFWADNKRYDMTPMQIMTPNEHREMHGCKYVWNGPLPEPRIEEYGTIEHWDGKTITKLKRCEYCGCFSDLVKGTCEHCGAPL